MQTNYLSPVNFTTTIKRLPNVEFFTNRATLPSVSMGVIEQPTPFKSLYNVPDRTSFGEFDLSFVIDENMNNYEEVLNWMRDLGSTEDFNQYKNLNEGEFGLVSDISLIITNSAKNPNIKFTFTDAFPITLSSVGLNVGETDVVYPEATVSFRYNKYVLERI